MDGKKAFLAILVIFVVGLVLIYTMNGFMILLGMQLGAQSITCNWAFCTIIFVDQTMDRTCTENGVVIQCPT